MKLFKYIFDFNLFKEKNSYLLILLYSLLSHVQLFVTP